MQRYVTLGTPEPSSSRLSHLVFSLRPGLLYSLLWLSAKLPPDLCDGPRVTRRQPSIGRFDHDPRR